jgi:hypothetical protein
MTFLEIEKADMTLSVINDRVGIPVQFGQTEISTLTRNSDQVDGPTKMADFSNQHLGYPTSVLDRPVVTTFDREIQDLINDRSGFLPYQVNYLATLITNPVENTTTSNFISKNSSLTVAIGAEVPMRLAIGELVMSDTIEFAGLPFSDGIEFFTIRANIHNAFPLDAAVYLYLMDENYQIIDSIWARRMPSPEKRPLEIIGGKIHPTTDPADPMYGRVEKPSVAQLEIPLDRDQIENLAKTRHFWIKGILSTSDWESESLISIFENSDTEGFLRVMIGCRIIISGKFMDNLDFDFNR